MIVVLLLVNLVVLIGVAVVGGVLIYRLQTAVATIILYHEGHDLPVGTSNALHFPSVPPPTVDPDTIGTFTGPKTWT